MGSCSLSSQKITILNSLFLILYFLIYNSFSYSLIAPVQNNSKWKRKIKGKNLIWGAGFGPPRLFAKSGGFDKNIVSSDENSPSESSANAVAKFYRNVVSEDETIFISGGRNVEAKIE